MASLRALSSLQKTTISCRRQDARSLSLEHSPIQRKAIWRAFVMSGTFRLNDRLRNEKGVHQVPIVSPCSAAAGAWRQSRKEKRMSIRDAKARQSASLQTPTNLSPDATRDISGALNILLADMFALYLKAKNFHWHIAMLRHELSFRRRRRRARNLAQQYPKIYRKRRANVPLPV